MKYRYRNIILIVSIVFTVSCDVIDNDFDSVTPLDSKVEFKVVESYDYYETIAPPQIFIEMITEKIYPCSNYGITTDHTIGNKSIDIEIIGIYKPGVCLTALGPARASIKLGEISGVYEIMIHGKGFTDEYNLLISDSLIILDGNETPNTKHSTDFMYRYPKNSFAYLCGTTISHTMICQDFIDTLKSVINISEFHFSDIAEIPYPTSSQGYYYNADARFFYYESGDDFEKISDVMKTFKQNHFPDDNGIGLSVINWMNIRIYSWTL